MNSLLITYIILNIANVIVQTIKSICTVRCGKTVAAIANAAAYGLYSIVIVYMVCELPLGVKATITALCNLVGVYIVKWLEEKSRKDKLWKVEATVDDGLTNEIHNALNARNIPHNYITNIGKYTLFNCYCATQQESVKAKEVLNHANAKYVVFESKEL